MSMLLVRIVLLTTLGALAGCSTSSKKPKSSAHLYEGDSPSIRYSDKPESAGGALNPY
jgi:uncharacterized protein YceK